MPYQHYPLGGVTDPHPVRPGTSAALTARTIDATIHPPIVRAQEAVAEVIPRIAAPFASPLFVGTIALTLLLVWAVIRNRLHVRGFLVSAILVLMLTSFRPMTNIERPSVSDDGASRRARAVRAPYSTTAARSAVRARAAHLPVHLRHPRPARSISAARATTGSQRGDNDARADGARSRDTARAVEGAPHPHSQRGASPTPPILPRLTTGPLAMLYRSR